jgi:hypothetical protein
MHKFIFKVVRFKFPAQNSNLARQCNSSFSWRRYEHLVTTPLVRRTNYTIWSMIVKITDFNSSHSTFSFSS